METDERHSLLGHLSEWLADESVAIRSPAKATAGERQPHGASAQRTCPLRTSRSRSLLLSGVVVTCILFSKPVLAVLSFTAGSQDVTSGDPVTVPISVSGFSQVGGVTYDSLVLQYRAPPSSFGLPGLGAGDINSPIPGTIIVTWENPDPSGQYPTGVSVLDQTVIFAVSFTANGDSGNTSIGFSDGEVFDYNFQTIATTYHAGTIQIAAVPEPVNAALGVFACISLGAVLVRRIIRHRESSRCLRPS
jgi:hypothetical protein